MGSRVGKGATSKINEMPFLSDGIIINILSRLPAKCVMRCRLVCKVWKILTSTFHFMDLHLRNSIPSIVVANRKLYSDEIDPFAIDKCPEPTGTGFMIQTFPFYSGKFSDRYRVLLSHSGLIALHENISTRGKAKFIILNPVLSESVTKIFPKKLERSVIYGVYFHPMLKEYCSLWMIYESGPSYDQPKRIRYKILTLSSNPSMKTISNPFSNRVKRGYGKPLLINNYLYWLLESNFPQGSKYTGHNDIMEFDTVNEEFMRVIPCPDPLNTECMECQTLVLNIEGILSFVLAYGPEIFVWSLEGHADKMWTSVKYTLSMDIRRSLALRTRVRIFPLPVAVGKGELVLQVGGKLLVCNLMDGTIKKYPRNEFSSLVSFFSHHMSLASLKNCKATISIDKDGEVVL